MPIDRQTIDMLLSLFLTSGLGMVLYSLAYIYSLKRKKHFVLRAVLCVLGIGIINASCVFGIYAGFVAGMEVNLVNMELLRMASAVLSLAMLTGALFICYDESPYLILFATVASSATHVIGSSLYEIFVTLFETNTIYFSMYNGYSWVSFLLFYVIHVSVMLLSYFLFGKAFAKTAKNFDKTVNRSIIGLFAIFSYVLVGLQGTNVYNNFFNGSTEIAVPIVFDGFMAIFAIFVLFTMRFSLFWVQSLQEKEAEKNYFDSFKEKVEVQEKNMELINLKCHDMKHQLRTLLEGQNLDNDFIEETQKAISIFDSQVKTGNDTLDTLLTQKSLVCGANKIQLTVMLDGPRLSFMSVSDINSFFGNAIDNAVEYLTSVDEENRFIRISSFQNGNVFSIRVENYCNSDLTFQKNGLPSTTKEDDGYHGFGTKSIQTVAKKYGGDALFSKEGNLFIVSAVFMI